MLSLVEDVNGAQARGLNLSSLTANLFVDLSFGAYFYKIIFGWGGAGL
jgi:hypothetical protein